MAITKQKKQEIVSFLENNLSKAKSIVFVNFHKLLVKDASLIRKTLKSENINYLVSKKSLLKKVLEKMSLKKDMPEIKGEIAIVFGDDLIAPARSIYGFQKKLEGIISIVGGVFDGEYKNKEEMMVMATIPSENVLRGMFVNVINSPIQRFAIVLNEIAKNKN